MKKLFNVLMILSMLLGAGCIKETYDMDKFSDRAELSPSIVLPLFRGKVVLADAVKESDTVVYDNDNFVRLVYKKDSVADISLDDYINVDELVSFNNLYTVGEIVISPFTGTLSYTLDEVTRAFSSGLRNQFVALDDGSAHPFPAFPQVTLLNKSFTAFPNFQYAAFSSGMLDISVTNNFKAPLSGLQVSLSNQAGRVGTVTLPVVNPGATQSSSLNLAGVWLTNTLNAAVTLTGSPGAASPVIIDLDNNNITFTVSGRDLKVTSGRVIVPSQLVSDPGSSDTVSFSPGDGIELDMLKVNSGTLSWNAGYTSNLNATLNFTLPTILRNGTALSDQLSVNQSGSRGSLSLTNTLLGFNADPKRPYNKIPIQYSLSVNSGNVMIDYNSADKVSLDLKLENGNFDYIKGYFGQRTESIDPETIDFGIEEYIRNLTGDFLLASPSIKISYENSFAVPIELTINGEGKKRDQKVSLGLQPFVIAFPAAPARTISSSFVVNKDNSALPQLISLPPESIVIGGSARMNPAGDPQHRRDNYVYGNSRLLARVEVELPLELSLNNLQLSDTTENYFSDAVEEFDMLSFGKLILNLKNGFPFDVSVSMSLYDSATRRVLSTIDVPGLLKAAPVDSKGKVTGITESLASVELKSNFIDNIDKSDQMIFNFRAGTTGKNVVKIYSDYSIEFGLSMALNTKIEL